LRCSHSRIRASRSSHHRLFLIFGLFRSAFRCIVDEPSVEIGGEHLRVPDGKGIGREDVDRARRALVGGIDLAVAQNDVGLAVFRYTLVPTTGLQVEISPLMLNF